VPIAPIISTMPADAGRSGRWAATVNVAITAAIRGTIGWSSGTPAIVSIVAIVATATTTTSGNCRRQAKVIASNISSGTAAALG